MKEALSSYDVAAVVNELQTLVGGRLDKIYHPSLDHLVLAVRMPPGGKTYIHFRVGKWIYTSPDSGAMPQQPSDFAMMLRKRVTNARISEVTQQGFDRIAVIGLEKDERFDLVLELFGDGNAILVKDGAIVQPLTSHTWKHRDVRARKPFVFPPPVPDPNGMSSDDLKAILEGSDTDLVRTLATKLNLGGRYSEEICARAGIEKFTKALSVDLGSTERILNEIRSLRKEALASGKGYVFLRGTSVEDVVPVEMQIYREFKWEEFPSFSDAIANYITRIPAPKEETKDQAEASKELARLGRKLAQQENAVMRMQDETRETQLLGDFLFAKYAEIAGVLSMAKERLESPGEMQDVPGFLSFDEASSLLTVERDGNRITLDVKGSVESNAERYYEEAKRIRKKLGGALSALQDTKRAIQTHESGATQEEGHTHRHRPTKRFWFERYRWFISSEGAVVLGGKDAKSNDILVKKHLEAGDRYAHADVHGAPSIVVKMREGVTESTLEEACEFAVANSKAWNAKVGAAAGYWVLPEQVSKTPQSGEYLGKGAFVIRGKRNYTGKLEIKLGIGEIEFEGEKKIMAGPEGAVKVRSKRFVVIKPGEKDKNEFAKQLADAFKVPIEEIQRILPPGDVEIAEQVGLSIAVE